MNLLRLLTTCGLLGAVLVALPADAATTYIVPGTYCRHAFVNDRNKMTYWVTGQVENTFGTSVGSIATGCPLPRHNATSNLTGTAYARVYNKDSSQLRCQLEVYQAASNSMDFEIASTTSVGYQSLEFDTSQLSLFTYGRYALTCPLAKNDKIDSIRYAEP